MSASFVTGTGFAGTYTAASGPTVTLTGYTPIEDDVVIVIIGITNTATAGSGASGWADCGSGLRNATDSSMAGQMVYHLVTAAEETAGTNSWTLTNLFTGTETGVWLALAARGGDPTSILDSFNMVYDEAAASTTQYLAGLTGTNLSTDSLVVAGIVSDLTTRTFTTPSGWTQRVGGAVGGWLGTRDALTVSGTDIAGTAITINTADETISFTVAITAGTSTTSGTLTASVPLVTSTTTGTSTNAGTLAASLSATTGAATGTSTNPATLAVTIPKSTGALTGTQANPGNLAATLPRASGSIADQSRIDGTLTASVPLVSGAVSGQSINPGTLAANLPLIAGTIDVDTPLPAVAALERTLPVLAEARTLEVAWEDRSLTVAHESRTLPCR